MKIKLFSTFSGIGAFEKGLDKIGQPYELYGYSEIDKYASEAYALIHNTEEWMNFGDITKIDETIIEKDIDFFTYGFPCQDISLAGNQKGLIDEEGNKTRSGLVWDATRIIKASQPKIAIAENVKNLVGKKFKKEFEAILTELEEAGYNNYWKVLNAKEHGIAQNRERVFIVSIRKDIDTGLFEFPETEELKTRLLDYLEDEVDEKYYLSDKMIKYISSGNAKWTGNNDKSIINKTIASTINTGEGSRRADASNYIALDLPENYDLKLIQVGQMYGTEREPNPQAGRIYDPNGISPTLDSMQGGNRMPKIIMPEKTDTRNLKEKLADEIIESGIVKSGDVINHSYAVNRMTSGRRTIESDDGIMPTLTTRPDTLGVVIKDTRETVYSDKSVAKILSNIADVNGVANTITANPQRATIDSATLLVIGEHRRDEGIRTFKDDVIGTIRAKESGGDKVVVTSPPLRIRKLTPKECFRLMGFDDEDHDVVEQAGISNSQRYKMAGNSIVVNVVVKILKNLIESTLRRK